MEHVVYLKKLAENSTLIDVSEISRQSDFIFQKVYLYICFLIGKHNKSIVD